MTTLRFRTARLTALGIILIVAGCASTSEDALVADPIEPVNRAVHQFNKGVDTVVLRPLAVAYDVSIPDPVALGFSNFANNLSLPSDALNHLLQGKFERAGDEIARFMLNSTLGFAGFIDIMGQDIPMDSTDFGATLDQWGVDEVAYLELPLLGPSTVRDTVGRVVDTVTNPMSLFEGKTVAASVTAGTVITVVSTRAELKAPIDATLYDTEDSYLAARAAYVQARRAQLNAQSGAPDEGFVDIYAN